MHRSLHLFKWLFRVIPPLGLLVWMVYAQPWEELLARLSGKSIFPVLIALAMNFLVCLVIRTLRWRIVVKNPPRFLSMYAALLEGQTANIVVGLGVNDFVRSTRLRPASNSIPEDVGLTLADRASEYMALMGLFLGAIFIGNIHWLWGTIPLAYFILLPITVRYRHPIAYCIKRFTALRRFFLELTGALKLKKTTLMVGLALLAWIFELAIIYLIMDSMGLPAGWKSSALVLLGINLAIAIPGPPANLGTFEAGIVGALAVSGIPQSPALSFAIFYHLFHTVPMVVMGIVVWVGRDIYRHRTVKRSIPT